MLITVLLFCNPAVAKSPTVFQNDQKIAASGYDVVASFTDRRPVEGTDAFSAKQAGATWRFTSAEHRNLFVAHPEKYAPQYGGYCAYAVSQGAVARTVLEAWSIMAGRLYLNYSLGVRSRSKVDKLRYIAQADAYWPAALKHDLAPQ
jgi:YHS domain-containing protein